MFRCLDPSSLNSATPLFLPFIVEDDVRDADVERGEVLRILCGENHYNVL